MTKLLFEKQNYRTLVICELVAPILGR